MRDVAEQPTRTTGKSVHHIPKRHPKTRARRESEGSTARCARPSSIAAVWQSRKAAIPPQNSPNNQLSSQNGVSVRQRTAMSRLDSATELTQSKHGLYRSERKIQYTAQEITVTDPRLLFRSESGEFQEEIQTEGRGYKNKHVLLFSPLPWRGVGVWGAARLRQATERRPAPREGSLSGPATQSRTPS